MPQDQNALLWLDMEMTGLNPDQDRIIELAVVVTSNALDIIAESPVWVVHQSDAVLASMDDWNQKTHTRTGLIAKVKAAAHDEAQVELECLAFIRNYVAHGISPMCGNSICQDRRFMARYMPELERYFHYRNLDVSTLKELTKRWAPQIASGIKKSGRHEALADIHESIEELKYYRAQVMKI